MFLSQALIPVFSTENSAKVAKHTKHEMGICESMRHCLLISYLINKHDCLAQHSAAASQSVVKLTLQFSRDHKANRLHNKDYCDKHVAVLVDILLHI